MEAQIHLLNFLSGLVEKDSDQKSLDWLKVQTEKIWTNGVSSQFFLAFSQASRFFKKNSLQLTEGERVKANELVSGFEPSHWNVLQTARTILMLNFPQEKEKWFVALNQLFETGDMYEQQALYAALPLMPFPEELLSRAIDGCRTNMTLIFDAIALNNPYPAKYFPEANWNQLVLKSIFMQRPIYRIYQLDERRNQALADIASDFAHERWAAGRNVMPELWRLVVPFVNDKFLSDLKRVIESEDQLEVESGILALYQCDFPPAKQLLQACSEEVMAIEYGEITWEKIGMEFQQNRV